MKDRIKKIRKELNLTQQEFADRLSVSRNNIGSYETGRYPSDAVISLICREFNVNEHWLRDGTGEMFVEQTRDETPINLINILTSLDANDWTLLIHIATTLAKKKGVISP